MACGAISMGLIYGDSSIKKEFNLIEVVILCILGPLLVSVYVFCYVFIGIANLMNKIKQKSNERKAKI